jgi:hypothetical protein
MTTPAQAFPLGSRVRHDRLGEGVVLSSSEDGSVLYVRFDIGGDKGLLLTYQRDHLTRLPRKPQAGREPGGNKT